MATPVPVIEPPKDNPKDALGSRRLPMDLIPDTALAEIAVAFSEGALKYGAYNWRTAGVRSSIYVAAARRHLAQWFNGEDREAATDKHHLAAAAACLCILLDAQSCNTLRDDRPAPAPMDQVLARCTEAYTGLLDKLTAAPR